MDFLFFNATQNLLKYFYSYRCTLYAHGVTTEYVEDKFERDREEEKRKLVFLHARFRNEILQGCRRVIMSEAIYTECAFQENSMAKPGKRRDGAGRMRLRYTHFINSQVVTAFGISVCNADMCAWHTDSNVK